MATKLKHSNMEQKIQVKFKKEYIFVIFLSKIHSFYLKIYLSFNFLVEVKFQTPNYNSDVEKVI